ncbi:MAG: hypothetical protein Q9219_007123, partial [cf. Caloplaca sp. 3 TL-2023]
MSLLQGKYILLLARPKNLERKSIDLRRHSGQDVLASSFATCKDLLKKEPTQSEYDGIFNTDDAVQPHKIDTFVATLMQARKNYEDRAPAVFYYGNILDVLVQHHPKYVGLAWGIFEFLFVALQNHAELISKISKYASRVADLLPQQKIVLVLYPTSSTQEAVARLYASIMKLFQEAARFYKDERVRELAALAAKAELRNAHIEIVESRRISDQTSSEIVTLKSSVKELKVMLEQRLITHGNLLTTLDRDVRLDLSQRKESIGQIHLNQLLALSFWQRIPTSGESLEYSESMRRRRSNGSILATQSYFPTTQKDFMIDMIRLLQDSQRPVIWALRFPDYWDADITVLDLLRMLVLQALQVNCSALMKAGFPITLPQMREASTQRDRLNLLKQALSGINHVFIALDKDLLSRVCHSDHEQVVELVESLRTGLSTSVKILASTSSFDRQFLNDLQR